MEPDRDLEPRGEGRLKGVGRRGGCLKGSLGQTRGGRSKEEATQPWGGAGEAMEGRLPGIPVLPQRSREEGRRQSGVHAL